MPTKYDVERLTEAQRKWAERQIETLTQDREAIDRRIEDLKGFLVNLEQSKSAVLQLELPEPVRSSGAATNGRVGLGDALRSALRQGGDVSGLPVATVAQRILALGYQPKSQTTGYINDLVRAELSRLAKQPNSGISKTGPSRFAWTGGRI